MDKALISMIENLKNNTGRSLEEWIEMVKAQNLEKHGAIIKYLKSEHNFTHGFANLVAHKTLQSDAGSAPDSNELIDKQYIGKEHFKPIYTTLLEKIKGFGPDVEVAPKNSYVSLRRKKQFAILQPATKSRFEVGLNLRDTTPEGMLEAINSANSMCSHKIILTNEKDINKEVFDWLKMAYDKAG